MKYRKLKAAMVMCCDNLTDIADLFGISVAGASKRMNGKQEWRISEIKKLCRRYNKTFEELFEEDETL